MSRATVPFSTSSAVWAQALVTFTFRFNRRRSGSRAKLFFRLAVDPVTRDQIVHPDTEEPGRKTQPPWGVVSQTDIHHRSFSNPCKVNVPPVIAVRVA